MRPGAPVIPKAVVKMSEARFAGVGIWAPPVWNSCGTNPAPGFCCLAWSIFDARDCARRIAASLAQCMNASVKACAYVQC